MNPSVLLKDIKRHLLTRTVKRLFPKGVSVDCISEDNVKNIQPPYIGLFFDFDTETEDNEAGELVGLPVSVKALVCSAQKEFILDAETEAFDMSVELMKQIPGSWTVDGKTVTIYTDKNPVLILRKSEQGSIYQCNFIYNYPLV